MHVKKEVEIKYLIKRSPELEKFLKKCERSYIIQVYHNENVRYRKIKRNDVITYVRTEKNGSGYVREETESESYETQFVFNTMLKSLNCPRLRKTRYHYSDAIVVDFIEGIHEHGFLEIEFDNPDDFNKHDISDFHHILGGHIIRDVTKESVFSNYELSIRLMRGATHVL